MNVNEFIDKLEKDRFIEVNGYTVFASNIDEQLLLVSEFDYDKKSAGIVYLGKRKYYGLENSLGFKTEEYISMYSYECEINKTIETGIKDKAKKTFPEDYNNIENYKKQIFESLIKNKYPDTSEYRFLGKSKHYNAPDHILYFKPFQNIKDVADAIKDKDKFIESKIDQYLDFGYQLIAAQRAFEEYQYNPPVELQNRYNLKSACYDRKTIKIAFDYKGEKIICSPLTKSIEHICNTGSGQLEFANDKDDPFLKMGFYHCNQPSINFDDIKSVTYGRKLVYVRKEDKEQSLDDKLAAVDEKIKYDGKGNYKNVER